jgi:hypothetical protein
MRKFSLFVYSLALESGIKKNINLNLFYSYAIVTNARVGIIRSWIFTDARVRNIVNKSSEHKPIKI